jgi:putative hydrolase of the HAD superfamily
MQNASFGNHHVPRAVLFDAVGTLIRPEPSVAAAYALAGHQQGIVVAEEEMQGRFRLAMQRQDEIDRRHYDGRTDLNREIERWRGIVSDVFGNVPQADAIFDDLWEHFARPANWRMFDDATGAWQTLHAAGITLGIASNFDDRLDAICAALEPLTNCRHVFVSSRVGWRKPRPEFFASISQQLGFAAEEMLLVGDDLENDYRAAQAAGWQAVLVDRGTAGVTSQAATARVDGIESMATLAELCETFIALPRSVNPRT